MKYLAKKVAIVLCKEHWAWHALNEKLEKGDWPRWTEIEAEYGPINEHCFFCHYAFQRGDCLDRCPYYLKYGHDCTVGESPFHEDVQGFNAQVQAIPS